MFNFDKRLARIQATPVKYKIGQKFKTRGKHPRVCTVIDIHRTYNARQQLIRVRYVATHEFLGQTVTDCDVPQTTIDMGYIGPEETP